MLRNTKGLQYLVNERLAKRPGLIGRTFKALEIGKREYGQHAFYNFFRVINWYFVRGLQYLASKRPVATRLFGLGHGPINYPAIILYAWFTMFVISRTQIDGVRDIRRFNAQDNPNYFKSKYEIAIPSNFLHHRLSAHYIEISNIYFVEMLKRYIPVRLEILAERDTQSQETQLTKYASNPNYIYESFVDTPVIAGLRANGDF